MTSSKDPSQPFPSPGSSFIPPPVPGPHEYAIRSSSVPRKMSKKDADDAVPDVCRSTTCNGNTTPTPTPAPTLATTITNGVALSSSPTSSIGVVSQTRVSAPLSFLRSSVSRFIVSMLNMPRSLWRVLHFQDPSSPDLSPALPSSTSSRDPPDIHSSHLAYDPASASEHQLSLTLSSHHTHHRLSSQSVTSLTSSRPAPPSPAVSRRASGLSRASSRPVSDMSSRASSRPDSRQLSGGGPLPASGTVQPTTPITTATTTSTSSTPTYFRHPQDRLPDLVPTIPASDPDPFVAERTPTPAPTTTTATTVTALIQIRDYGFALTDPRFTGQGPHVPRANRPAVLARRLALSSVSTPSSGEGNNRNDDDDGWGDDEEEEEEGGRMDVDEAQRMWEEVVDDGANGWSGFKWGFGRAWGFGRVSGAATGPSAMPSGAEFPSRGDLDRNFGGDDGYEDMEIDQEGEAFSDEEGEADTEGELPLSPGLYRAMYAFDPEGTAEMKLDEDQLVRVIGRGGGVGWAVVVKDGLKDTGIHALVPESYLELVRLDGEEEDA